MSLAHAIQPTPCASVRGPLPARRRRSTLQPMAATATSSGASLVDEETRLAREAAAGDGNAFAALYERYERRAFNLAYRVTGSEEDAADALQEAFVNVMQRLPKLEGRDLAFGSYLFTATRNACYDLMEKRRRSEPSDSIPESAAPVGAGAGGLGLDPGDPEEDPDRKLLVEAQQEEVREANTRLPERQREALALRELEELSYDQIAAIMEMNRNSVAQLISRARINLRDELRGTSLASIAATSPDCERALPLLAIRDDGQLDADSGDSGWLDAHLAACDTCGLALEAMQEAGASYRAWAPVGVAPWLFEETMAKAAEALGVDWSDATAEHAAARPDPTSLPGLPAPYRGGVPSRRRRAIVVAGLVVALLLAGVATVLGGDNPPAPGDRAPSPPPSSGAASVGVGGSEQDAQPAKQQRRPGPAKSTGQSSAAQEASTPEPLTSTTGTKSGSYGGSGNGGPGGGGEPAGPKAGPPVRSGIGGTKGTGAPAPTPEPVPGPAPDPAPEPPAEDPPEREDPPPREDPPDGDPPRPPRSPGGSFAGPPPLR